MSINIFPFKFKHFPLLQEMLSKQECEWQGTVTYKTLPKIGYIAMLNNQPVAAGFLRRLEGGYGQIDTFATNPYFGSQVRHEGIERVVTHLLDDANSLKLIGLLGITQDSGISKRANELGFKVINQTILGKIL